MLAVKQEFGDDSIMVRIAQCESGFRQFGPDGLPLKGEKVPGDTGVFQINKYYHLKEAQAAGMDINTLLGNIQFAHMLYESQGTTPWNPSRRCWSDSS